MARVLGLFTAAAAAALGVFMAVMGYVAWWLAPIMLAWNVSPLIIAWILSSRAHRTIMPGVMLLPWVMLLFAIGYVTFIAMELYDVFFVEESSMAGFAYLLLPFAGWAGLIGSLIVAFSLIWLRNRWAAALRR